jgi:hypothetical protein
MYINKLDDLFDNTINNFYKFLNEKKAFIEFTKDINFITIQNYIISLIKEFMETQIIEKSILEIITNKNNLNIVLDIIKRYIAFYIYLSIAYMYTEGRDLYTTNIIETSKNQKYNTYHIENFFNSENNAKLVSFFNDIKNLITVIKIGKTMEQVKIILGNNPVKFESTIKIVNNLGEDYMIEYILINENMHNIIKTIIFRFIYLSEEKEDIIRILKQEEELEGDYKYIEVVYSKESKLVDFTLIQKFLSLQQIRSGLAEEIYEYLDENKTEKELDIKEPKDYVQYLISNGVLVPITEDFLRYHKDSEKYESDTLVADNDIKERDATKIKYIINKMNKVKNMHSSIYDKNPKLRLDAQNLYYKPLDYKEAILYNDTEEIKIIQKLEESEKTSDLDLLGELENSRRYAYINYKDFSKDGFKFRPEKPTKCIRYTNITHKNSKNNKIEFRVGNDNLDINIVGFAWNPSKISLDCFNKSNLVDVTKLLKTDNGFLGFQKTMRDTFNKKKRVLFYWLFDISKDKPSLDNYVNLSNLNMSSSIFNLIVEVYKTYSNSVENKLIKYIDSFKELGNYDIENILKKYNNRYIDFKFDKQIKNRGLNYSLINKLIEKEIIDDEIDNIIPGKSGNIIKLPSIKTPKLNENIIIVSSKDISEDILIDIGIEPICHHYVKWKEINKLAKLKNDEFSQTVFDFVKQYVRENDNSEFICKSCSEVLDLKKYVFEGTYIAELDTFMTTSLAVGQELKRIPKYAKYTRTISNIEKNIEKIAFMVNLNNLIGNVPVIKLRRKMIVKDTIDLILIHTDYLRNQPKDRGATYLNKYGIIPELTNLFFFELTDDIFLTSSEDTDYYKLIKYNNVLAYILFIIITDLNAGQILSLRDDKRCNFYLFSKLKESIFGKLYIRINQKEKVRALDLPLLCYVIYYFSCVMVSNLVWLWNIKEKEKFNTIIQSTIIHTMFDLINSVFEANIYLEEKNFLYEIIATRLGVKLKHLFNDKDLLRILEESSNLNIKTDEATQKVSFVTKKIKFISLENNQDISSKYSDTTLYVNPSYCDTKTKRISRYPNKLPNNELSVTTNCPDGKFHKWSVKDNELTCSLCNQKYEKIQKEKLLSTEDNYQSVINQLKFEQYRKLLNEYCTTGELHEFDSNNVCSKCKINPDTYTYTQKDLDKFEKNMSDKINKKQLINIKNTQEYVSQLQKDSSKSKKIITKFLKRYKTYTKNKLVNYIDDFIDSIIKILTKKIKIDDIDIYLKDTYYFVDHDYLGINTKSGFKIFESENKIVFEKNNKQFNKDVFYYKDRTKNVTVYYDAISKQYLGYFENNKLFVQKSVSYLKVVLSIRDKILLLGLSSSYTNRDDFEGKYKKLDDTTLVDMIIRKRVTNLKQIINRTISIIHRVKNSKKEESIYSIKEKDIINTFVKSIKKFNVKNKDKSKSIFKHWKYISNKINVEELPENLKIDINNNYINTTFIESLNNLDSKLLFFFIYNLNRLLEYNEQQTNKSTLALLVVRLIEYNFDQYYIPVDNIKVRRFQELLSVDAPNMDDSLRIIGSYEELLNSQEIDDTPTNMSTEEYDNMVYDMQEENDALDLDDNTEEDEEDGSNYIGEIE